MGQGLGFTSDDKKFMRAALDMAKTAESRQEVPVGCVIVHQNEIIGKGFNQPILTQDPTAHAEIVALRDAGKNLKNYRLPGARMYVTLEPCIMCVGAIFHSRLIEVIYGARDEKFGAFGSLLDLHNHKKMHYHAQVRSGLFAEESSGLLKQFFQSKRK